MTKLRALIAGAVIAALAGAFAFGQALAPNLSGNECWNAGQGPGGPSTGFVCAANISSMQSTQAITVTGSITLPNNVATTIITAQPSAATITLPATPNNGAIVELVNGTSSPFATNVVTVAANANQTLQAAVAITTLAAHASVELRYNGATATWYQMR